MTRPILVTGFEPFGGASLNPSQLIVEALSAATPDLNLVTAVLPVEYELAGQRIAQLVKEIQPLAVVALGQAEGRAELSFERVALNLNDAKLADNSGEVRSDLVIDPEGATAHLTSLPVREMSAAANAAGMPSSLSLSAGTFVCNHVFYVLQVLTAETSISSGFVHVPLVTDQALEFPGKPTFEIDQMLRGVVAALRVLTLASAKSE